MKNWCKFIALRWKTILRILKDDSFYYIQVDKEALVRIKKNKFKVVFLIILFGLLCMLLNINQFILILSFNASNLYYYTNKMVSIKNLIAHKLLGRSKGKFSEIWLVYPGVT